MSMRFAMLVVVLFLSPVWGQSNSIELEAIKVKLDLPADIPLQVIRKGFRLDLTYTVAEFHPEKVPQGQPYITGILFHTTEQRQPAGEFAATVMDIFQRNFAPEKVEQVSEQKLDRKPGEWVQREYRVTEFGKPMRHVVISVREGNRNYALLLITPGTQDAKVSAQMGDRIVGNWSVAGVPAPGGGGVKPPEKPGATVAGVVFSSDMERDIFLLKEGENKPINLTKSPGFDREPAWSRDGTKIAFLSGRNSQNRQGMWIDGIYTMNPDGSDVKKVTPGDQNDLKRPRFSGDGKAIVYAGGHDFGNGRQNLVIQSINVDGSGHRVLTDKGDKCDLPDWSPDGTKIVYSCYTERAEGLYVMNADGSGKQCIVSTPRLGWTGQWARWSADGKTIVFTAHTWQETPRATYHLPWGAVFFVNPDGTNLRWNHLEHDAMPMLLGKGNKIAFLAVHGGDHKSDDKAINIWVKNVNGPHAAKITANVGDVQDYDFSPSYSDEPLPIPKLPYDIVFARAGSPSGPAFDLCVMTEEGKDLFNLTQTSVFYANENNPCWSPDKKKIVFDSDVRYWVDGEPQVRSDSMRNIWMMDADGSNRVNLTKYRGLESHPVWSPDGRTIAFHRNTAQGTSVHLLDVATGTVTKSGSGGVVERQTTWANDSTRFILSGDGSGLPLKFGNIADPNTTWTKIEKGASLDPDFNPTMDQVAYFGWNAAEKFALMTFAFPGGADNDVAELNRGSNPSWGPDGYRIVFDTHDAGDSNLFIADVRRPGALNLVNVTQGFGGKNIQPDWAAGPTKTHTPVTGGKGCIVFTRNVGARGVFRVEADGTGLKRISPDTGAVSWPTGSPDGKTIYFGMVHNGSWEICSVNPDGSGFRALTSDPAEESRPLLSPDGKRIAFVARKPDMKWNHVYVMNADGSGMTKRAGEDVLADNFHAWSPDSQRIFMSSSDMNKGYLSPMEMFAVNADGGGRQQITRLGQGQGTYAVVYEKCFSPDGKKMAVSICPPDASETSSLYIGNADGSGLQPVIKHSKGTTVNDLQWAGDGRIYFRRAVFDRGKLAATIVSCADSGGDVKEHVLPDQRAYRMRVSPDGKRIVFLQLPATETRASGKVVIVGTDGSPPVTVPNVDHADYAEWVTVP